MRIGEKEGLFDRCYDSIDASVEAVFNLMLPDAYDLPPHPAELFEVPLIPLSVFTYFLFPKVRNCMLPSGKSVPMPIITVNENGDLRSWEYDVGFPRKVLYMFLESQSPFMKL